MAKLASRIHSRYGRDAARLLGLMIRDARIDRHLTVAEVAERAGVSRGLVHRVEAGDMGCSIGAVFELAAIVGLRLFDADQATLGAHLAATRERLALLPRSVRPSGKAVKDEF